MFLKTPIFKINTNLLYKDIVNNLKCISLNFGPQHPAAHGVLRLMLNLNNEVVKNCDPHIGLLHRGTEKLMENKIYIHSLPYFDRLDYVSTIVQENVYCIAIDKYFNLKNQSILNNTKIVFDELTRILNHLLAVSCHALDVGSMSTIFWSFEERENIMEFYERLSGARMHTSLYKPIIFNKLLNYKISVDILNFSINCFVTLNEIHSVLTNNKVWKTRLVGVGMYNYQNALNYGLTGVMARCVGIKRDIRLNVYTTYNNYNYINFNSYVTNNGDSFDRYLLRMYEMIESLKIIIIVLNKFKNVMFLKKKIKLVDNFKKNTMELIINHFKYWGVGFKIDKSISSTYVESPKGEFSITLFTDNSEKPYRCKIKSPSLQHLQFLKKFSKNVFLADIVTLIGTIDIVFGEIDR